MFFDANIAQNSYGHKFEAKKALNMRKRGQKRAKIPRTGIGKAWDRGSDILVGRETFCETPVDILKAIEAILIGRQPF